LHSRSSFRYLLIGPWCALCRREYLQYIEISLLVRVLVALALRFLIVNSSRFSAVLTCLISLSHFNVRPIVRNAIRVPEGVGMIVTNTAMIY